MGPVHSFRLPSSLFPSLVFNKLVTEETSKLMIGMHPRKKKKGDWKERG